MRIYLGFDDTDDADADFGTGRLVRDFCAGLNHGVTVLGIVRHQLPRLADIPYTSHNSSACVLAEIPDPELLPGLVQAAAEHLVRRAAPGADPGLCCAAATDVNQDLVDFALACNGRKTTQAEAMRATAGLKLHGLGGTNDGIIGAAAAVGLTRYGWCGRFIAWKAMRGLPDPVTVGDLARQGVRVVSVDRDPLVPQAADMVSAGGWLRPSLWAGEPVLQVLADGAGRWRTAHAKRPKNHPPDRQPGSGMGRGDGTGGGLRTRPAPGTAG